jgi:hypothetical protein
MLFDCSFNYRLKLAGYEVETQLPSDDARDFKQIVD